MLCSKKASHHVKGHSTIQNGVSFHQYNIDNNVLKWVMQKDILLYIPSGKWQS